MKPSPVKRDNADLTKLITGTMDSFLTDFRDEKLYFILQVRCYLRILQGAFLQLRHSDNNGIKSLIQDAPLWWQIKFEKPIRRRKVKPLHTVLCQRLQTRDKKIKKIRPLTLSANS